MDVYEVISTEDKAVSEAKFSSVTTLKNVVNHFLDGDKKVAVSEFSKIKNLSSVDPVLAFWKKRLGLK